MCQSTDGDSIRTGHDKDCHGEHFSLSYFRSEYFKKFQKTTTDSARLLRLDINYIRSSFIAHDPEYSISSLWRQSLIAIFRLGWEELTLIRVVLGYIMVYYEELTSN